MDGSLRSDPSVMNFSSVRGRPDYFKLESITTLGLQRGARVYAFHVHACMLCVYD